MSETAERLQAPPSLAGDAVETDAAGRPLLVCTRCADCGARVFPPVAVCPECMSETVERLPLSAAGTLYSWSVVHAAPRGWTVPYIAGYVDLPEKVRVFAHIVGADAAALDFDMAVELCIAELGTDETGAPFTSYAFRPTREGER